MPQKSQRLKNLGAFVIPGAIRNAFVSSRWVPHAQRPPSISPVGFQSPPRHPGAARAQGLEMSEAKERTLPPLSTQRPRRTRGETLPFTLAPYFSSSPHFHFSFLSASLLHRPRPLPCFLLFFPFLLPSLRPGQPSVGPGP